MTPDDKGGRLEEILQAATRMFATRGYRRTRMADVAASLGVTEAALYRYVEGKDALFDQIVRRAAAPEDPPTVGGLPLPTPPPGSTLEFLRGALAEGVRIDALERALSGEDDAPTPAAELEAVLRELYAVTARHRAGLKIVERSAADWPELAEHWFGEVRPALIERLATYLADRREGGALWAMPNARASARLIVETVAFFAMHRHDDPFPPRIDDETAEETAVRTLLRAHLPAPPDTAVAPGAKR